jgi:hypothetical protein
MDRTERISRKDRERGRSYFRVFIIAVLILLVIGVAVIRFTGMSPKTPPAPKIETTPKINLAALSDSLVIACCKSFGLGDSLSRVSGHSFYQSWPAELPFINFAERLSQMASANGLFCDCLESQNNKRLSCVLKLNAATGAQVVLQGDKKTKLSGREVAIILDNIGSLKEQDLTKLIRNGTPFGYFATPEVFPMGSIKSLFSKADIPAFLKLPSQKSEWERLAQMVQMGKNRKGNAKGFDISVVEAVFDRHPTLKAIYFDTSKVIEREVVTATLDVAKRRKVAYFMAQSVLFGKLDSLAASKGLRLITLDVKPELRCSSMADLKLNLFQQLLDGESEKRVVICPDASKIGYDDIIELRILFERLGIRLRPCMKLTRIAVNL